MNKIILLSLLFGICCAAVSCHTYSEEISHQEKEIELSQEEVHFKEGGGDISIKCLNYSFWMIAVLLEWGQDGADNIYYPVEYSDNGNHHEAVGDGIKVMVDDNNREDGVSSVRIIVDPCTKHRSWKLRMHCVDVYTTIRISQN